MRLTKHHGLGNDFLVLLDPDGDQPTSAELAVALCDRRTGIGADGLLRVGPGTEGADVTMELRNADGSVAEMSGNGIRCLAQAAFAGQMGTPPVLRVATAAGLRTVTALEVVDERTQRFSVEMGQAKVGADDPDRAGGSVTQAVHVDVGNPHVVLLWAEPELPGRDELVTIGSRIDEITPGGANTEVLRVGPGADELTMVVYERGVGPTQACGTGACAVAAAAHHWGLTGTEATVHMPGGAVTIALGDPVVLTGAATHVAVIDVPWR